SGSARKKSRSSGSARWCDGGRSHRSYKNGLRRSVAAWRADQLLAPKTKSPGNPGLFAHIGGYSVFRDDRSGRELVIDAGPEDVVVEADAGLVGGATEIGGRSQIDVEVFELARPVRRELLFDAGTSGPANPRLRLEDRRADHRHRPPDRVVAVAVEPLRHQRRLRVEFDFADREAARDVQQEARIGQPAGAAAE